MAAARWPARSEPANNQLALLEKHFHNRARRLFADTIAGAQASANLYSLVETGNANGIDPYRYLVWLFAKLPLAATADAYAAHMPWALPSAPNL